MVDMGDRCRNLCRPRVYGWLQLGPFPTGGIRSADATVRDGTSRAETARDDTCPGREASTD